MMLFGGELENGNLTNDLWLYNITLGKWTELAVNDSEKPPPLAEHTGTIVDDELYIFGGKCLVTNNLLIYMYMWYKVLMNLSQRISLILASKKLSCRIELCQK